LSGPPSSTARSARSSHRWLDPRWRSRLLRESRRIRRKELEMSHSDRRRRRWAPADLPDAVPVALPTMAGSTA
jgi:hypothetical protein